MFHVTHHPDPSMSSISERVRKHRAELRAAGMRPLQIWVPDTRRPGFADECRRQSSRLRDDPAEQDTLRWLSAAADRAGWE
jgi:hypothetical protein